jgi:hypothetical protein
MGIRDGKVGNLGGMKIPNKEAKESKTALVMAFIF